MSNHEGSSTSDPRKAGSFPGTTNFEGSSVLIVTDKLNGINYREWAQAVKLAIGGRGKIGFLTGTVQMPTETDVEVFSEVRREASRRKVMLNEAFPGSALPLESAALVSKSGDSYGKGQKGKPMCDYCKKMGHT
ncbi:hypothetical protein L6164_008519 [Bauhinia variegata]|uniref:Uncharacterized protein n=1 Tax=Bauhinia variegata TaxID=167791 RepID=A0ACB9PH16_BAUVA|nr:hypothetical protein L6164_008519 [Bauhinia variegata]